MGLELYYGAFLDLCTCRSGFGDGPISWQATQEYALVNQFDSEQLEDLHYFIQKMDEAFLQWRRNKDGKQSK